MASPGRSTPESKTFDDFSDDESSKFDTPDTTVTFPVGCVIREDHDIASSAAVGPLKITPNTSEAIPASCIAGEKHDIDDIASKEVTETPKNTPDTSEALPMTGVAKKDHDISSTVVEDYPKSTTDTSEAFPANGVAEKDHDVASTVVEDYPKSTTDTSEAFPVSCVIREDHDVASTGAAGPPKSIPDTSEAIPANCVVREEYDITSKGGTETLKSTIDTSGTFYTGFLHREDHQAVPTGVTETPKSRLYVFSAYDENTGKQYLEELHDHLSKEVVNADGPFMANLADTLSKHRSLLPWKTSMIASSLPQIISSLQQASFTHSTKSPRVGFVFTGQGAQWHAMARSLLDTEEFRKSLDLSNEVLESLGAGWSVVEELQKDKATSRVNEAVLSQPLCTIIQIALVDLLKSWNIIPTAVIGHSSGEIAAAYASGTLSLKGAVTTAYYRGLVVGTKKRNVHIKGAMAAIRATQSEVLAMLSQLQTGKAHIACHNSPRSFTVSGDEFTIYELIDLCASKEIWARRLLVDIAYHSPKMQSVAEEYHTSLLASNLGSDLSQKPSCEQYSSVTGQKLQLNDITPGYWVENMTKPVLFSDALVEMCTKSKGRASTQTRNISSIDLLIEIGPHGALAGPVREIIQSQPALAKISYLSALNREEDAVDTVLKLASRLFDRGYAVDIQAVNQAAHNEHPPLRVKLPSYPWNHSTRYWAEPRVYADHRLRKWPRHELLGAPMKFDNALEPRWRNWIRLSELPWLRDHRVQSLVSLAFHIWSRVMTCVSVL